VSDFVHVSWLSTQVYCPIQSVFIQEQEDC